MSTPPRLDESSVEPGRTKSRWNPVLPIMIFLFAAAACTAVLIGRQPLGYRPRLLMVQGVRHMQKPAGVLRRVLGLDSNVVRGILKAGIPGLSSRLAEEDRPPSTLENVSNLWFEITCGVSRHEPVTMLAAELPLFGFRLPEITSRIETARRLARVDPVPAPRPPVEQPAVMEPSPKAPVSLSSDPVILVFHTHTSEAYIPDSGKSHIFNGQGDIVRVGRELADALQNKYMLPTLYMDRIHDQYPWHEAYLRSHDTIVQTLREHPSIRVVIDVHRDSTPGLQHTTIIDGRKTARIMLVVGTDRMGLAHPNWQKNYAFAERLKACMDELYPGLSLGIIKADARYNQHLSEGGLIAEFGSENCSLEEARMAATYFARVLATVLGREFNHDQNQ